MRPPSTPEHATRWLRGTSPRAATGAADLARAVWAAAEEGAPDFRFLTDDAATADRERIEAIATRIYGADGDRRLRRGRQGSSTTIERLGLRAAAGLHGQDAVIAEPRPRPQGPAARRTRADSRCTALRGRRLRDGVLRRHADDAGPAERTPTGKASTSTLMGGSWASSESRRRPAPRGRARGSRSNQPDGRPARAQFSSGRQSGTGRRRRPSRAGRRPGSAPSAGQSIGPSRASPSPPCSSAPCRGRCAGSAWASMAACAGTGPARRHRPHRLTAHLPSPVPAVRTDRRVRDGPQVYGSRSVVTSWSDRDRIRDGHRPAASRMNAD